MSIGSPVRIRGEQMRSFPACLLLGAKEQIVNASEVGGGQWVLCKYRVCSQVLPALYFPIPPSLFSGTWREAGAF